MSIKISKSKVEFIPELDGNLKSDMPIKMKIARLNLKDFWIMASALQMLTKNIQSDEDTADRPTKIREKFELLKPIFDGNVSDLEGVEYEEGEKLKPSDLLNEPGLLTLVTEIANKLIEVSQINSLTKKNQRSRRKQRSRD